MKKKMTKVQEAEERKRLREISKLRCELEETIWKLEKVVEPFQLIAILEEERMSQIGRYIKKIIQFEKR